MRTILPLLALAGAVAPSIQAETFKEKHQRLTAAPKELAILVVDEDGNPRAGAQGRSISYNPKTGQEGGGEWTADGKGLITCKDPPYFYTTDMRIQPSRDQATAGWRAYEIEISERDFIRYDEPNLSLRLTLPYILKPIPLKAKRLGFMHRRVNKPGDRLPADPRLPDLAVTEIGYDAEMLEPVEPHGRGKRTDFTITLTSAFTGFDDAWTKRSAEADAETGTFTFDEGKVRYGNWIHTVTYRFPHQGDGIILSPQFWPYCKLTVPHQAPAEGYVGEITLQEARSYHAPRATLADYRGRLANNGLFLRVRTRLDKDGNVLSAHYAKIVSPQGAGNSFLFFYNPTPDDRNLEYDRKTNLLWKELHPHSPGPEPWDDTYNLRSN